MRRGQPPRRHGQTWATFLQNHANDIWACDFLQLTDMFFQPLFAFLALNWRTCHQPQSGRRDQAVIAAHANLELSEWLVGTCSAERRPIWS